MKVIVYSRLDGGVTIVNPTSTRMAELIAAGMTEAKAIAVIQAKSVPNDAMNIEVMDKSQVPASREFRNAWEKLGTGPPTINMPKARIIHSKKIVAVKAVAIVALQKRADEATLEGRAADATRAVNDKAAVESLNLTTVATQIAAAPNPTALSAIWPAKLLEFRP